MGRLESKSARAHLLPLAHAQKVGQTTTLATRACQRQPIDDQSYAVLRPCDGDRARPIGRRVYFPCENHDAVVRANVEGELLEPDPARTSRRPP